MGMIACQIMLLNGAETSTELNLGIYGYLTFQFDWPIELYLQISTLNAEQISILNVFLYHAPGRLLYGLKWAEEHYVNAKFHGEFKFGH